MAKRRTRTEQGQFIADNPETPEVDEAWEQRARTEEGQFIADNSETPEVDEAWEEVPIVLETFDSVEKAKVTAPKGSKVPVELELKVGSKENKLSERRSKESIEASVKEKLSRKTDSDESNPFVPQTQLENEVKEVAKAKGFPLSRGTEVGARLIARSNRRP